MPIPTPYNLTLNLRLCGKYITFFLVNITDLTFVQPCLRLSTEFETPGQTEKHDFFVGKRKKCRKIPTHKWNFTSKTSFFQFTVQKGKFFVLKFDFTFQREFFQLFGKIRLHCCGFLQWTCFEKMFARKSTKNTQIVEIIVIFAPDPKYHRCLWKRFWLRESIL